MDSKWKKETESEQGQWKIKEEDFKLGGCPGKDVRNPMSAEQEDKVNEISRKNYGYDDKSDIRKTLSPRH